jgi:hypothetical protein
MTLRAISSRLTALARAVALDPWASKPILALTALSLVAAAAYRQFFLFQPNHDVAWFVIAASRLIEGGRYVDDIYEVNAPLAVLIYCPAALLAKGTGLGLWTSFLIASFALMGAAVLACGCFFRRLFPTEPGLCGALVLLVAGVLFVLPGYEFGQREHYAVILLLPFVVAAAAEDAAVPLRPRSLLVGLALAGAVGALIKPFFVLFPALIFGSRMLQERSFRFLARPDFLAFLLFGLGYLILLLTVFRGWIDIMLDTATLYRSAYDHVRLTLGTAVLGSGAAGGLVLASLLAHRPRPEAILVRYTALAALAAVAIFVFQAKGWKYQYLPVMSFLLVSAGVFMLGSISRPVSPPAAGRTTRWTVAAACLALVAFYLVRSEFRPSSTVLFQQQPIYAMTSALASEQAAYTLSSGLSPSFPLVLMQNRTWSSRFPCLWMLKANDFALRNARDADERAKRAAFRQKIVGMIVADFERYDPALVLVDLRINDGIANDDFDFLTFFRTEPALEPVRRRFRQVGQAEHYAVFTSR